MYKQNFVRLFSLFFVCLFSKFNAQISVSPASGCLPIGLTNAIFVYTGSGTPTNIVWNYGDGSPTSGLLSTQHSYPNQGTYVVTFSALINGSPVTYTAGVGVYAKPTGNFSFSMPPTHCAPMTVNFTGTSSSPNVIFTWAFGDLSGGNGPTTSHAYGPGTFIPNVTIQNSLTGCFTNVVGNAINVSNLPIVSIASSAGFATCANSFITALDGSGSISGSPIPGGTLTYAWNYSPFGASTQVNTGPINFSPTGIYPVVLTVTDNNNCSNSDTKYIKLESPTVTAVVPPTVCVNFQAPTNPPDFPVTVTSNQPSTTWDMGDGTILTFPPPPVTLTQSTPYTNTIYAYSVKGPKVITITVQSGACVSTITKNIMVEEITATFVATPPSFTCSPTFTLGVINQTSVNTSNTLNYLWTVNHWDQQLAHAYHSTLVTPVFTVTEGSLNPYTNYGHPPYFISTKVVVTSAPVGCKATFEIPTDTILRPTAMFETNKMEGCVPLTVTFSNTSATNIPAATTPTALTPYAIQSYTWNFGAGPASTLAGTGSVIPAASYNYTATGVYYATLTILTAGGCSHTSYSHTITVVDPPNISYTFSPPSPVCAGVPFTVLLSSTATVQHWHVDGDEGYFSGCVSDAAPTWTLNNPLPSPKTFTISAYLNSCKSTLITSPLVISGPSAKLKLQTKCFGNRKQVKFFYDLSDVATATLSFGDGSSHVIAGTPGSVLKDTLSHTYLSGNYIATLTAVKGSICGPSTSTVFVSIRDLQAKFEFADSVICKGALLNLNAFTSQDVALSQGRGYSWYVENMQPVQADTYTAIVSNTNIIVGMHPVTLVVKDTNGCSESLTKYYRISAPAPQFSFSANPICLSSMPVQLINQTPQILDSVLKYTYYEGDSILYALPPPYHSVLSTTHSANFSPSFSYPTIGTSQSLTFTVTLFATNDQGCTEYKRHTLTVNNPNIDIKRSDFKGCIPAAITFSFFAANTHTNYAINWGDGGATSNVTSYNTNATYTTIHVYNATGNFVPSFTLTDNAGCIKTQSFSSIPMIIQANPVSTFSFYNVIDNIPGPGPFCAPLSPSVVSIRNSPYPLTYSWDLFGTGGGSSTFDSTAFTNYPDGAATYTISLKVSTIPSGCASFSQTVVQVFAPHINYRFEPDSLKNSYCLGEPITLYVNSFAGVQYYKWDFSDGVVMPPRYPVASIPATLRSVYSNTFYPATTNGSLTLELVGYAEGGSKICKDVQRKIVKIIRAFPEFNRNNELLKLDSIHCIGQSEKFTNLSTSNINSTLSYTWSLGDGIVSNATDVAHTYSAAGTYSVKLNVLEPINSCTASITKKMVIFPLPTASLTLTPYSCPNTPFGIEGSGSPGVSGLLTGSVYPGPLALNFSPTNTFSLSTTASVSTTYSLKVIDDNGCESAVPTASIFIQQAAPVIHWDTTIIIGSPTPLNAYAGSGFSYTWTPVVSYLNCDTCLFYNPISTTTTDITYSVSVEDGKKCSVVQSTYKIHVDIKASLDVPSAFTPNGDGTNDVIYPAGWGLRKLNYFKIFNRWGQLVFESNDLSVGWDGTYQGVPQNIETYVYQASVDTFDPYQPTLSKTGTFKLLR